MKGKSLNKRLSTSKIRRQQHLLEVTVRADKARAMRYRAVTSFIFKTILWCGLATGLYFGGQEALRRFVWENPDYYVSDIRVVTGDLLQRDQILETAGVREGMNIFNLDTKVARAALDALPQVERAEIQRVLPNRVDITITERRPIAWVTKSANDHPTTSPTALLIDARSVVIKPRQIVEQYHHLPQISGVPVVNLAPGQKVMTVEMESALKLIQLNADNTHWQVRHIDLSKQWCMVVTDQNNARITFSLDRVDEQVDRLFRYFDRAEAEKREIATLNLMVVRYTPVTFRDPSADDDSDEAGTPPPIAAHESNPPKAAEREKPREAATTPKPADTQTVRRAAAATPVPSSKSKTDTKSNKSEKTPSRTSLRKPFLHN